MKHGATRTRRHRFFAFVLAALMLLPSLTALAMPPGPDSQPVTFGVSFTGPDGNLQQLSAFPVGYQGFEDAFYLYVSPEAAADPNAQLFLRDGMQQFPGGFSSPQVPLQNNQAPLSALMPLSTQDGSLGQAFLQVQGLGQMGEALSQYRLFVSFQAPLPQAPEGPGTASPAAVVIRYLEGQQEFAREDRTYEPGTYEVGPNGAYVPAGYELQGQASYPLTVDQNGASQSEFVFTYAMPVVAQPVNVTIVYQDENQQPFAQENRSYDPGNHEVGPDPAYVPAGYELLGQASYPLTVDQNGATQTSFVFTYKAPVVAQPVNVTIVYQDENQQPFAQENRTYEPGNHEVGPDPAYVPSGYELLGQASYPLTVDQNGATQTTFVFTYKAPVVAQPVSVTIVYQDENQQPFAQENRTYEPGDHQVGPDPAYVPAGYELVSQASYPLNVNENGANQTTFVFTYKVPVVIQPASVTIRYLTRDNLQVADPRSETFDPGNHTVYAQPGNLQEGYELDGPDAADLVVDQQGAHPSEIIFYYKQKATPEPQPQTAQITVRYVDAGQTPVAGEQTLVLNESRDVLPDPVDLLPGYELEGPAQVYVEVAGNTANPSVVTFQYKQITVTYPPVNIQVNYLDETSLQPVATATTYEAKEGQNPVEPQPQDLLEGYALSKGEDAVKYVTVTQGQANTDQVTFLYAKAQQPETPPPAPKVPLVPVTYENQKGETLYSETVPAKEGEQTRIAVDVNRVNPAQYQLEGSGEVIVTVDQNGLPNPQKVVFLFKDISVKKALVKVFYRDQDGQELAAAQEKELTPGAHQIEASPGSLPAGMVLQNTSPVTVTVSESGLPDVAEVVFLYGPAQTPVPTEKPEPTPLPFDLTTMDRYAYPNGKEINFRSAPEIASGNVISVLTPQSLLHILGSVKNRQGEEWYLADLNGTEGFIKATTTKLLSFDEAAKLFGWTPLPQSPSPNPADLPKDGEVIDRWAEVTDPKGVNFRTKPATSSTKITTLDRGERFWVYSQQTVGKEVWYKVKAANKDGYLVASYSRLYSPQESAQYQASLPSPMPTVVPTATVAPVESTAPVVSLAPVVSQAPPATQQPQSYHGYAITTRQVSLHTGASSLNEPVLETLPSEELVYVWGQTYVGNEGWSNVRVLRDNASGYLQNNALRYITENEYLYYQQSQQPVNPPVNPPQQRTGYAVTRGPNVPLRSYADSNARILMPLPDGAVVRVIGQEFSAGTTWHLVQYSTETGYVRDDQLRLMTAQEEANYVASLRTPVPQLPQATLAPMTVDSPSSYGYVNNDRVRLRSGPSTKDRELKLMSQNAFALVYESKQQADGTWYRISQDGTVGWVKSDFFTVLPMGQLSSWLQSPAYLNNNQTGTSGQTTTRITPVEDFNTTVWQNPSLQNPSYEPFNPLGSPTPSVEEIATPTVTPSESPSPTPVAIEGFEEPKEKADSGFPTGVLIVGLLAVLGGGGYYAYHLYQQNQKRAAQRAAQRRQQAAQQSGQPQTRPAQQQPQQGSPYAPPRPGMQGTTAYQPQTGGPKPGQPGQPTATQGTTAYRPQVGLQQPAQPGAPQGTTTFRPPVAPQQPGQPGQPGQPTATQGTTAYKPQVSPQQAAQPGAPQGTTTFRPPVASQQPGQPGQPTATQGTTAYKPQVSPQQPAQPGAPQGTTTFRPPVAPQQPGQPTATQGTTAYKPQASPQQPAQPGQTGSAGQAQAPSATPEGEQANRPTGETRRRRSDRHGNA